MRGRYIDSFILNSTILCLSQNLCLFIIIYLSISLYEIYAKKLFKYINTLQRGISQFIYWNPHYLKCWWAFVGHPVGAPDCVPIYLVTLFPLMSSIHPKIYPRSWECYYELLKSLTNVSALLTNFHTFCTLLSVGSQKILIMPPLFHINIQFTVRTKNQY